MRHQKPTRITCVTCDTPICPECAIRTPVGYKCPDHATKPAPPRSSRFGVVVVVVGVVAIVGFLQVARSTGKGDPVTPPCPTETAPDVGIGARGGAHWAEMSPSGLCGRYHAAQVWTGSELLIWGGENCAGAACPTIRAPHLADGAAYKPATNAWRKLAKAPLSARAPAATAWTGTELLVWGGVASDGFVADGAAYDPARNRWRPIAGGPLAARSDVMSTWTGTELVVWGGADISQDYLDGAAYDPAADRWRTLAPTSLAKRSDGAAVWSGREMIVWGGVDGPGGSEFRDGAAYDPAANRWRAIAASPLVGRDGAAAAWTGRELLIWGGTTADGRTLFGDGAAYDPATDRWRMMSRAPLTPRTGAGAVWSGHELVVWGGIGPPNNINYGPLDRVLDRRTDLSPAADGAAYDPATDRWRPLEPVPLVGRGSPIAAWDGNGMLLWGGLVVVSSPASSAEGVRYTP